jgi:arylsulfatase A-like enzyme
MSTRQRPHLILITTDQQRWDTVRALGHAHAHTPHLDALTRHGIAYTRMVADCPICIPSRTTLLTGRNAATDGRAYYADRVPLPVDPATSLPGLLAGSGYQTVAIGKMHSWPTRARYGFQHQVLPFDYHRSFSRWARGPRPRASGMGENEWEPVVSDQHEDETLTAWLVDQAVDLLETRDPTAPLYLHLSFTDPHPPLDPTRGWWDLWRDRPVPAPVLGEWLDRCPLRTGHIGDRRSRPRSWPTESEWLDIRRAYHALIQAADAHLGRFFARLRELGMWDDSLILFTSDHGEMLGDHGGWGKATFLAASARVPFLVKPPKGSADDRIGGVDATPGTLADVMPTFLAAAGVGPAPGQELDGRNLLAGGTPDRMVFGEVANQWHGVCDGRFTYIWHHQGGAELLFDDVADPGQIRDLSPAPAAAADLARLRSALSGYLEARGRTLVPVPRQPITEDRWQIEGWHSSAYDVDVLH